MEPKSQFSPLRAARIRSKWTQRDVAERLQALAHLRQGNRSAAVNADMVSKWERGEKGISPFYRDLLCELFACDARTLGLDDARATTPFNDGDSTSDSVLIADALGEISDVLTQIGPGAAHLESRMRDVWKDEMMRRRTILKLLGMESELSPAARLSRRGGSVQNWRPRDFHDLADRYQELYHSASPSALIAPVLAHLDIIYDALRAERADTSRRSLLANRSRVALLAGRLSFFDLGDSMSARGYYNLSVEAASEAGDHHQAAAALGHMAFVPAAEGSLTSALDYLEGAKKHVDRDPHGPLKSWVHAIESEFYTTTGDHDSALRSVDQAKAAYAESSIYADLPWFDYYNVNRLAGFAGYANLRAGRYEAAATELHEALNLPLSAIKQRAVFLADLATVHYFSGELEQACSSAIEAIDELRRSQYVTGVDRLREFRGLTTKYKDVPAVREFSERLSALQMEAKS